MPPVSFTMNQKIPVQLLPDKAPFPAKASLKQRGGLIINISSIAGLIASDTMPAYNASKAAVWMLSKSIALARLRIALTPSQTR